MAYQWTTNHDTPVTVDGQFGPQTLKALQYGLGVSDDGTMGPVTAKALQSFLGVTPDGSIGPVTVKALQAKLGVSQDGDWGPATTRQLQAVLNAGSFAGTVPAPAVVTVAVGQVEAISVNSVTYGLVGAVDVDTVISQAMTSAGVSGSDWVSGLQLIISHESAGNPNAVNDYDLNAHGSIQADGYPQYCSRGLAQCIPPTFAAWHVSGTSNDIYDGVANVAAAIKYIIGTYGSIDNVPGVKSVRAGGAYEGY